MWSNSGGAHVRLARRGDALVMGFARMGFDGAQPVLRTSEGIPEKAGRGNLNSYPDALFIARARVDLPQALDEIERLRAEVERLAPFEAHVSWLWGDTEPGKTPGDMVDRARKRLLMYLVAVHRMSPGGAVEMADDMASDVLEAALQPTARDKTGEDALTIATALEAALNPEEN
jgi:hypothetical protein